MALHCLRETTVTDKYAFPITLSGVAIVALTFDEIEVATLAILLGVGVYIGLLITTH